MLGIPYLRHSAKDRDGLETSKEDVDDFRVAPVQEPQQILVPKDTRELMQLTDTKAHISNKISYEIEALFFDLSITHWLFISP